MNRPLAAPWDMLALAGAAHRMVTVGFAGLVVTGSAMAPDLDSWTFRIKLALVLVLMLNGINARRFLTCLQSVPPRISGDNIPWRQVPRAALTAGVSQLAWWGSIGIGFLTTTSRHR